MAWRGVVLTSPARLSLDNGCCRVEGPDGAFRLAFEDIAYMVLETPQASLTSALLSRLAENNVLVLTCDARHMPNGAMLPLQGYHRQTATFRMQLAMPGGLRNRLWQRLVRGKIANQSRVLAGLGDDGGARALAAMAERVASGDPDNIEARAARDYFGRLFADFRRDPEDDDPRNAMLNYAYALLRAAIARALTAQGFHPATRRPTRSISPTI